MKKFERNVYDGFNEFTRYYVIDECDGSHHQFSRLCDAKRFAQRCCLFASVYSRLEHTQIKVCRVAGGDILYDGSCATLSELREAIKMQDFLDSKGYVSHIVPTSNESKED